jgi:hypothetical protein
MGVVGFYSVFFCNSLYTDGSCGGVVIVKAAEVLILAVELVSSLLS